MPKHQDIVPTLPHKSHSAETSVDLLKHYQAVRNQTEQICAPLELEDWVVQPAVFVSPPKWHLAHTSWFFVNFGFHAFGVDFDWPDRHYPLLFNSYYKSQSEHWLQGHRGDLSRPTVKEIMHFREDIDECMQQWLSSFNGDIPSEIATVIRLGLEHEQQHQELLLMDIKYILWCNPGKPAYFGQRTPVVPALTEASHCEPWWQSDGGLLEFGAARGQIDFCFDNETPRHKSYLSPYRIATSLVSNAEYQEFIEDGGYNNALLWLSEGWDFVQQGQVQAPLYWSRQDDQWYEYDLYGLHPVSSAQPVKHISFHEAYAYARWKQQRLPSECEWEYYASQTPRQDGELFMETTLTSESVAIPRDRVHGGLWE